MLLYRRYFINNILKYRLIDLISKKTNKKVAIIF